MKITDKLAKAEREGRPFWSFEFFPPRTAQGLQNLYDRIERMRDLGPEFIDITWGAGGKNADLTSNLVQVCQETIGLECCMHLCCTEMPKEKVEEALAQAKASGCQNILALRGDPPRGSSAWEPTADGFYRAADLVHYIHQHYPGDFCVAVAGFPQGHPETSDTDEGRHQEVMWLKEKVEAGAEFIFTQMFYDTDILFDWIRRVRDAGITVPIVPGIMPIQNWDKFQTWVKREKIVVPPHFYEALNPIVGDDEKVRAVGTKLVAEMCRKILGNEDIGIKGLHIYTLNLEKGARMLLQELQLEGRRESIAPFPWRPSLTPHRRSESIRPIFWANRVHSYLSRTDDWDEFPNGRWGDSRSPAYGDLDGYPVSIGISPTDAYSLWGHPSTFSDICHLFSRFCRGDLAKLPWSSQPPASETSVITDQLAKMNALGYLTINSQPAVDGVRSDDKVHGWGPPGGYVYQKAYLEFFVSPELLSPLIRRIERDPRITYYAVNKQGDLRTNTHSEGPNAVTWGVFPGKEIVQPTIVEAVSFIAWKDEAFELGLQWANLYPESSPSRRLIEDTMSTSYLVNIVANDFRDGQSIFQPFVLDQKMHNGTNGHESSETPSSQGVTVVLGAQWGDEGKGKLVDILAAEADICARCAGGNNAGHTIVVKGDKGEKKTYAFNLLPSGLINPKCIAYIGSGVVVHIPSLFNELDTLERKGLTCSDRLFISDRAHLVLGFHQIVDGLKEIELGGSSIGTTKKGIGPAYSSKASRSGLRVHHLYDPSFPAKFRKLVEGRFKRYGHFEFDTEGEIEMYLAFADRLRPHIVDGPTFMHSAVSSGKRILVEGANALMLDIDYGTYPFVTSSATSIGGVITGLGIPPMAIKRVLGVIKAYTTRVGGGPFPTEDLGTIGEILQEVGAEFGVVTGRRRRCGWLDLVVMRYSTMINGYTALNLTKLDVLDGFEEIKVATGYKIDGVDIDGFPADLDRLARVEVQYTTLPGWKTDISNCTQFDELPPNCGNYVHFIEEFLGVKVQFIGVGPARESTITVF